MGEDLKKLYDSVSAEFDIGDFETFSSKMKTPEERKSFYDKVSESGLDLGDFESYEQRLTGEKAASEDVALTGLEQKPLSTEPIFEEGVQEADATIGGIKKKYEMPVFTGGMYDADAYNKFAKERFEKIMSVKEHEPEGDAAYAAGLQLNLSKIVDDSERLQYLSDQKGGVGSFAQGVGRGVTDYFGDYAKLYDTVKSSKSMVKLSDKLERLESGEDVEFSEMERDVVEALNASNELHKQLDDKIPTTAKVGEGVGQSLGFAGEFALTGGIGKGIGSAIKGGSTLLAKGARTLASKATTAALQTAAMPTFYKESIKNMADGDSASKAIWDSYYDTYTDVFTEKLFVGSPYVKGAKKGVINEAARRIGSALADKKGFKGIVKATGEEFIEEKFAEGLKGIKEMAEGATYEEVKDRFLDLENNALTFYTVAAMTGTMGTVKGVETISDNMTAKLGLLRSSKNVNPNLKERIDLILGDEALSIEQMKEAVDREVKRDVDSGIIKIEEGGEALANAHEYGAWKLRELSREKSGELEEDIEVEEVDAEGLQSKLDEMKEAGIDVAEIEIEEIDSKYEQFKTEKDAKEQQGSEMRKEGEKEKVEGELDKDMPEIDRTELQDRAKVEEEVKTPIKKELKLAAEKRVDLVVNGKKQSVKLTDINVVNEGTDRFELKEGINKLVIKTQYGDVGKVILHREKGVNTIGFSQIDLEENRKKGIGSYAYKLLANELKTRFNEPLVSGETRTDSSERMWQYLIKDGIATYDEKLDKYKIEGANTGVRVEILAEPKAEQEPSSPDLTIDEVETVPVDEDKVPTGPKDFTVKNDQAKKPKVKEEQIIKDLDDFNMSKRKSRSKASRNDIGFFFSTDPEFASSWGKNVKERKIDFKKPLTTETTDPVLNDIFGEKGFTGNIKSITPEKVDKLKEAGYDGIIGWERWTDSKTGEKKKSDVYLTFGDKGIVAPVKEKEVAIEGKDVVSTKQSRLGARMLLDETKLSKETKTKIKERGVDKYEPQSDKEANEIAENLAKNNPVEVLEAIFKAKGVSQNLKTRVGAQILSEYSKKIKESEKQGKESDAKFYAEKQIEVLEEFKKQSVETARGLRSFGITELASMLSPFTHVENYKQSVEETREKVQDKKSHKKKLKSIRNEAGELHKEVVEEVLSDPKFKTRVQELIRDIKVKPEVKPSKERIKEIRKTREDLKKQWLKERKGSVSSTIIPGLTNADLEFGGKIALTYIQEGYVRASEVAKKLVKDFKDVGVKLSEDDALKMVPEEFEGTKLSDLETQQEVNKAAKTLAKRIIKSVSETKESKASPVGQMISTLLEKFKERDVSIKEKKVLKTDLDKITEAILEKEQYADTWSDARDEALQQVRDNEDLTDAQKEDAVTKINKAYETATQFTFTEEQVKRAVKKKARELDVQIDDLVRSHYTKQASERAFLEEELIDEAGLVGEDAKVLAKAIERAYSSILKGKAQKIVDKYVDKHSLKDKRKDIVQKRKDSAQELIELINANALDDAKFREVFADVQGLPVFSDAVAKKIKTMAEAIQLVPSASIKNRKTENLMAELANQKELDWGEMKDFIWYTNALSGFTTQLRNIVSAQTNIHTAVLAEAGVNPAAIPLLADAMKRGFKSGRIKAKDIVQYGHIPFESKAETPGIGERVEFKGVLKAMNFMKYVTRFMNASDQLAVSMGKEAYATLLAYEAQNINWHKHATSKEYRAQVNERVKRDLYLDKEQAAEFEKQVEEEAEKFYYNESEKRLRFMELVDESRDPEVTRQAIDFAQRATGNIKSYGTLGMLTDGMARIFNSVGFVHTTKTGREITVKPFSKVAAFVKIASNVGMFNLDFVPGVGAMRAATGKYGMLTSLSEGTKARYTRELTPRERQTIMKRQLVGLLVGGMLWGMSEPDEDGESFIRITANGTGNFDKNKALPKDWKPYSIYVGDQRFGYKYSPLLLMLAPIGFARDAQRFRPTEGMSSSELLAQGMMRTPSFIMDATVMANVSRFFDVVKATGNIDSFQKNLTRYIASLSKPYYAPGIVRDTERLYDFLAENPQKQNKGLWDRMLSNAPVAGRINREGQIDALDALGRPVETESFWTEFIGQAEGDRLMDYNFKQTKKPLSIPKQASIKFNMMQKDGEIVYRALEQGSTEENNLWFEFNKIRGQYLRGEIELAISAGITGEEYEEFIRAASIKATKDAKLDVEAMTFDKPVRSLTE